MLKDTKSLGNNKAPACESRGFVHKKRCANFDTPPFFDTFLIYLRDLDYIHQDCSKRLSYLKSQVLKHGSQHPNPVWLVDSHL